MSLFARLSTLGLFSQCSSDTLEGIVSLGVQRCLRGGESLFDQGDRSRDFYLVLSGRLIIVRKSTSTEDVVGYVRAGEPVGEMSLMSGDLRTASAFALRDTELLAFSRDAFEEMMARYADFAAGLAKTILERARRPSASLQLAPPRVFALVASSPSIDIESIAAELGSRLKEQLEDICVLNDFEDDEAAGAASFRAGDVGAQAVLLPCRIGTSAWYKFALRHADRIFLFARRDARPPSPLPLSPDLTSPARRFRLVDLVAIHEGQGDISLGDWVRVADANRVFHWTDDTAKDRLARAISGRTLALVLSGGGARAYSALGVYDELIERGVKVDFIGGASMGAIIGACIAMGWSRGEIEERLRDGFVQSNPLSDHVLPVVAMTRGKLVEERLERHFGDIHIENMPLQFYCVSSELTRGVMRVHRRGLLRHALRASISLPGVLPPVVDGHELLVDGAVINNFPTDVMKNFHRGLTIGVDVARQGSISAAPFVDPPNFVQWVRRNGFSSAPPVVSLLMRAATARREVNRLEEEPDILITPPVPGVDLRDWSKFDASVTDGREAAILALDTHSDLLAPYCDVS